MLAAALAAVEQITIDDAQMEQIQRTRMKPKSKIALDIPEAPEP